ncbi:MAG: MlaD family protein [Desulfococcaceae bacterium]
MSKKASPTLIGLFVVGAAALVVIGIIIFGAGTFWSDRPKYVLYFEGGVAGLTVGSQVAFRGVRVGTVSDIRMYFHPNDLNIRIPVIIEIDPSKITNLEGRLTDSGEVSEVVTELVGKGLRAQLKVQSLVTGQLYVEFGFHPEKKANFVSAELEDSQIPYPELPTIPSDIEEITRTLEKIPIESLVLKAIDAIEGIERMVNSADMEKGFTALSGTMTEIEKVAKNINREVIPLATEGRGLLRSADKLVVNTNEVIAGVGEDIEKTVAEAEKLVRNMEAIVDNLDGRISPIATDIQQAARAAQTALNQARQTLSAVESITTKESPLGYQIYSAVDEFAAAARSIRIMAEYLERHPEALIQGKRGR